jgi:hypothetical protein
VAIMGPLLIRVYLPLRSGILGFIAANSSVGRAALRALHWVVNDAPRLCYAGSLRNTACAKPSWPSVHHAVP